jgi:hypothetical protein
MVKEGVVDTEDCVDSDILALWYYISEDKEWLSNRKKVVNLALFLLAKLNIELVILLAKLVKRWL